MDHQRNVPFEDGEGLAESPSGDAPADGVELGHEGEHPVAGRAPSGVGAASAPAHDDRSAGGLEIRVHGVPVEEDRDPRIGHSMAKAGSFQRTPRAHSGAWNFDIW